MQLDLYENRRHSFELNGRQYAYVAHEAFRAFHSQHEVRLAIAARIPAMSVFYWGGLPLAFSSDAPFGDIKSDYDCVNWFSVDDPRGADFARDIDRSLPGIAACVGAIRLRATDRSELWLHTNVPVSHLDWTAVRYRIRKLALTHPDCLIVRTCYLEDVVVDGETIHKAGSGAEATEPVKQAVAWCQEFYG